MVKLCEKEQVSTLFKNISILNERFEDEERNVNVGVEEREISYHRKGNAGKRFRRNLRTGSGKLLMPAFYNAHAHSPMGLMRGYGENLSLQDWLNTKKFFPFEDKLYDEAVYYATPLAMAESTSVRHRVLQ